MARRVNATPSEVELTRWSREVGKVDAVQVRELGAQIRAAGEARLAESEAFWERLEADARQRPPEGSLPCPYCSSWLLTRQAVDGFRAIERCSRCLATWPVRAIEPEEA